MNTSAKGWGSIEWRLRQQMAKDAMVGLVLLPFIRLMTGYFHEHKR